MLERSWRLLTAALIVSTLGLFGATGMLYFAQSEQRQLLAVTVRTSGWVAYQAQLEYVKASAALDIAAENLTPDATENLKLRLELLLSRLPILYDSEEGRLLADIQSFAPMLRRYERTLQSWVGRLAALRPGDPRPVAEFAEWKREIAPLGRDLQKILETSVVYNDEIYRRERELSVNPATIPLALMFVSGGGLVVLLILQAERDRRRLADVLAARAAQAATESNFRAAIEAMPANIAIVDRDDTISFVNPSAAELVDPSPDHPDWQRLVQAARESASDGGPSGLANIAFARPGGDVRSLRGLICEIVWEGKPQHMLALVDITQVRDAELQVMQAAKLATLGEMATAIAHEANQPLAVIKMAVANAMRLLQNGADAETLSAKLSRIGDQVDRIKRITNQVRRYGRMPSRQATPFALRGATELAIGFVAEQYRGAGIRLEIDLDFPPDLSVAGEQTMFEQVIVNILVNARDAFEDAADDTAALVVVRGRWTGGDATIEIEDNAGGIRAEILNQVFEPFATTKTVEKGTGLGLSMTRNIVRDMHGTIEATNVGAGARFTITLPVAAIPARAEAA